MSIERLTHYNGQPINGSFYIDEPMNIDPAIIQEESDGSITVITPADSLAEASRLADRILAQICSQAEFKKKL